MLKNTTQPDTVIHYTFHNFPLGQYDPALVEQVWAGIPTVRLARCATLTG